MKSFAQILQDRGCNAETAATAATVIEREIRGDAPDNRTESERQAVERASWMLDRAIQSYG